MRYKRNGVATQWSLLVQNEKYGRRWNYSNEFSQNPVIFATADSLEWPLKMSDPYGEKERFKLDRQKFVWIHLDWTGGNVNDWWSEYNNKITEMDGYRTKYPNTIYCTLWKEIRNYTYSHFNNYVIALQYWFFYPFNDFANDHEGDWEHINVIVSSQFPDQRGNQRSAVLFP